MSKLSLKITFILLTLLAVCQPIGAKLTDEQVIEYIKTQSAAGKSEQQIGKELLAKGITPGQIERLKGRWNAESASSTSVKTPAASQNRMRSDASELPSYDVEMPSIQSLNRLEDGDFTARKIYGHDVFSSKSLSFEPNDNLATPANYRLGPGDEIIIDIWGESEDQVRQTISPEGSIIVSQIGPVYLNGLTINEANNRVRQLFVSKYAGVEDESTDINVSLGQVRTIQVNVMGEVNTPGTYRLSPFATVFNALYNAGGINDIGTLRNIEVLRDGRRIVDVDLYEYLFAGKQKGNARLQEGDVIIVPPYAELVNISGNVKRPMYYEMKEDETLAKLLEYAGGFSGDAYSDMITVERRSGKENELYNVDVTHFNTYRLKDGDLVSVGSGIDRFENRVELKGAVVRPGMYAIGDNLSTLSQLLNSAEGLMEDAFTERAIIYREGDQLQLQVIPVNLEDLLSGTGQDILLQKNDLIVISSLREIFDAGTLTIRGQVANPGTFPFAENTTVEDLIIMAGGLLQGASTARVDVSRRIIDPTSLTPTENTAQIFTFALKDGLMMKGDPGFILEPYDVVEIRKSPGYQTQRFVTVNGEVLFEGSYALQERNERISSIIGRAGGVIDGAYLNGARLLRKMTQDEIEARDDLLKMVARNVNEEDSVSSQDLLLANVYSVGIELDKALKDPGGPYDIVMKDGDVLSIPEEISTVKISGTVMFPNVVSYQPGKKLKDYIHMAGGYGEGARKNKVFIVYMNGMVAKAKGNTPIEPGCQIVVPAKPKSGGTNWPQIVTLMTSFASLGTMAATIYSIFR